MPELRTRVLSVRLTEAEYAALESARVRLRHRYAAHGLRGDPSLSDAVAELIRTSSDNVAELASASEAVTAEPAPAVQKKVRRRAPARGG